MPAPVVRSPRVYHKTCGPPQGLSSEPAFHACNVLQAELQRNLGGRSKRVLRYASDCTGGDAPKHAWDSGCRVLSELNVCQAVVSNEFSSETAEAIHCHQFITSNSKSKVLFKDMVERALRGGIGKVMTHFGHSLDNKSSLGCNIVSPHGSCQESAKLPEPGFIDNYQVGFVCKDLSGASRTPMQLLLDSTRMAEPTTGASSQTLLASVQAIKSIRCRTWTIENVGGCPAEQLVSYLMSQLGDMYTIMAWKLEALDLGEDSWRFRLYIVGVFSICMLRPPAQWHAWMDAIKVPRHSADCTRHFLARSSPEVLEEQAIVLATAKKRTMAIRKRAAKAGVSGGAETSRKKSCAGGTVSDYVFERTHQAARDTMIAQRLPQVPQIPSERERLDALAVRPGDPSAPWAPLYPLREQDLVNLYSCLFKNTPSIAAGCLDIIIDLTEPAEHSRSVQPRVMPTGLARHRYYWPRQQRHILGLEQLWALGFPHDINCVGVPDSCLHDIAGNTMSVKVLCTLQALMLSFVNFDIPIDGVVNPSRSLKTMGLSPHEFSKAILQKVAPHANTSVVMSEKLFLPGLEWAKKGLGKIKVLSVLSTSDLPRVQPPLVLINNALSVEQPRLSDALGMTIGHAALELLDAMCDHAARASKRQRSLPGVLGARSAG